jgi:foldase protein PrsA
MIKTVTRLAALLTAVIMLFSLASCSGEKLKDSDTVMTIDGMEVPYSVLRYFIYNYKSENDAMDADFSDGSNDAVAEQIMSYSVDSAKSLYAIFSLAEEYGLDPFGDVMQTRVDTQYDSERAAYDSKKEFKEYLSSSGLCEESFRLLLLSSICADEIYYAMVKNGDINTDKEYIRSVIDSDEFIRVLHILVVPASGSAEDDAAAKAKAEEAHSRAVAGEDFLTLVKEYGDDVYMYGNSDGYYIMKGVWQREFENVAFSLDIGEISDVFYTSSGYSILLRLEKESDYIDKNIDSLCDDYADAIYNTAIDNRTSEVEVTETELFEKISVGDVK